MLFHAHSGVRYLVLLLGFVNVIVLVVGLVQKTPPGKLHRILGSSFAGSLHLQVTLGLILFLMGNYPARVIGHVVMMLLAAALAQALLIVNRKRPQPGHVLPLIGIAGALVLIFGGVMAIGRGLFEMTAG